MTSKLPDYFRDYLDERFKNVLDEIQGVKVDVSAVKKDISDLKKTVSEIQVMRPILKKNEQKMGKVIIATIIIAISLTVHMLTMASPSDTTWLSKILGLLL